MLIKQSLLLLAQRQRDQIKKIFRMPLLNQDVLLGGLTTKLGEIFIIHFYLGNTIIKVVEHVIRDLLRIRQYLPVSIATMLVISILQFAFYDTGIKDVTNLHFQNCLTRVLSRSPGFTHSKVSALLPVRYRIMSKICTITYQVPSCKQPSYLHYLITPLRKPVQLR